MEVKTVVRQAKEYVADLLAEEGVTDLGLEEVFLDDRDRAWNVTVGFSRPWNMQKNAFTMISGAEDARRTYRVVKIDDADGRVLSFTKRDGID
ncbi:hypothetical protein U0C82_05465 [Fulvimarina sp. 2208YS6-2-32]|uniref:PepSY domain-containing protein n=1 Tax=Fulvimarina uroteuthidis TaxID=3098149 RepID=A0ABU5I0W8_9HYPH|nr:hypothetical protein [Fulvimarina sp. 2208YS6-2-32]MDY8108603.1 hypothetical protein [Fulvimarina sp. 2208YS6-2-32]